MRYPPRSFRPASAHGQFPRMPLSGSMLVGFLLFGIALPVAAASSKPVPVATSGAAVPLSTQQLADIAAKGVPAVAPAPAEPVALASAPTRGVSPAAASRAPGLAVPRPPRRLPCISEALGPIPREEWIRRALAKPADTAVLDGRTVVVRGTAPTAASTAEVKR